MASDMTSPDAVQENEFGESKWLRIFLFSFPPLIALAIGLHYQPFLIDDAYITFRYADNLAAGRGLTFNAGEPVLGTTSPLLAIMLALLKLAGIGIPEAALGIGYVAMMLAVLMVELLAARFTRSAVMAGLAGLCLAVHPDTGFTANSGMETGLSMAAVYGGLLLILQGRWYLSGLVGAAAFLLRPDGALIVVLAVMLALISERKKFYQPIITAGIVALPWLIYATLYYGWPVPHSVAAKQIIHHASPLAILQGNALLLTLGQPMKIILVLCLLGIALSVRLRAEAMLIGLWMALYVAGLCASRIMPVFPWYITPLVPGIILLACLCLIHLARELETKLRESSPLLPQILPAAVMLAVAFLFLGDTPEWKALRQAQFSRESAYARIAELLKPRCKPGDVIMVGEVGVLSYLLPDQVIIDSSGINSKEVSALRAADRKSLMEQGIKNPANEGSREWVSTVIQKFSPDYIVTYYPWLHIEDIMMQDWFGVSYSKLSLNDPELNDYFVFEKNERR